MRFAWKLALTLTCLVPAVAADHVLLRYLNPSGPQLTRYVRLVSVDSSGNFFALEDRPLSGCVPCLGFPSHLLKTDSHGVLVAAIDFNTSIAISSINAGHDGNLLVAGSTIDHRVSSQLPPLFPSIAMDHDHPVSFVLRLDAQLRSVVSSLTSISGSAMTLDAAGNIYLTGNTTSASFQVTPGVFHGSPGAFLAAISSKLDRILFSTYFDGSSPGTQPQTLAVDSSGAIVLAGYTDVRDLPVTPGAYQPTCNCDPYQLSHWISLPRYAGFVAKFSPGAANLEFLTYVNPVA